MNPSFSTHGLSIGYSTTNNTVLANINLDLRGGELICLIGTNGIGKSTLIRTICGLQKKLSGSIKINGQEIETLSGEQLAAQVSVVLTDPVHAGNLTAYELVALGRYPHTNWLMSLRDDDIQVIDEAIKIVGIEDLVSTNIHELSDGQRQKCQIARALAQESPIMLLDEPTTHLDLNNRVEVMRLLRELAHSQGKLILVATHEIDLALQMSDSFIVFSGSELIKGVPEDLILSGTLDRIFELKGYDLKTGRTLFVPETETSVQVSGSGHYLLWTKNAIERSGYSVVESSADFNIHIEMAGNETSWIVTNKEESTKVQSIEGLLNCLKFS